MLDKSQASAGGKDLHVIAISMDRGGRATVAPFVRSLNMRHLEIYLDPEGRIVRAGDDDNPGIPFVVTGCRFPTSSIPPGGSRDMSREKRTGRPTLRGGCWIITVGAFQAEALLTATCRSLPRAHSD